MKNKSFFLFLFFLILSLFFVFSVFFIFQKENFSSEASSLISDARNASLDHQKWEELRTRASRLPAIFPFSSLRKIFFSVADIASEVHILEKNLISLSQEKIMTEEIFRIFSSLRKIKVHVQKIKKNIKSIPSFLLSPEEKLVQQDILSRIEDLEDIFGNIERLENIFAKFVRKKSRVLVLLQNQNEPRSSGGFVGSLLIFDFGEKEISWKFEDIYALDRKIPIEKQIPAPVFFQNLSQNISLRDANLFPHFPTTAEYYRKFFRDTGETPPETIIAINLNLIGELLRITGPVSLPKWDIVIDERNFDLVLQFLVEAKVEGRFGVKKPVLIFAQELFKTDRLQENTFRELSQFSLSQFLTGKNILAHSQNRDLQNLFEKWKIDGSLKRNKESDNFLYFDFVSVGANKSDKFVWTKIKHNSQIFQNGKTFNRLEIIRNNTLSPGEILDLLGTNSWTVNLRDLLTRDIRWILGEGQNRIFVRVYLPHDARILTKNSPSGDIKETLSNDKKFKILDVPLFINPQEKIKALIEYETFSLRKIDNNTVPYFLELVGTPGRTKTEFLETISPENGGKFKVETMNIGRPVPLVDQYFRALLEF